MILTDFVMLGTTIPEPCSDGRVFVCSAGYSADLRSLIRIYPLSRQNIPHRWDTHRVPVERNPGDSRRESWKVAGDRSPGAHERINIEFESLGAVPRRSRADLLRTCVVPSIAAANDSRSSLAIIEPKTVDLYLKHNPDSPDSPELALFDLVPRANAGAKRFAYMPRMRFTDSAGDHDLMLRDWGAYERMRKHGAFDDLTPTQKVADLSGALHLDDTCSLLVGNLNHQRNAWLVISVLRGLRQSTPSLFDEASA